jgi:hypothetical protein
MISPEVITGHRKQFFSRESLVSNLFEALSRVHNFVMSLSQKVARPTIANHIPVHTVYLLDGLAVLQIP